MTQTERMIMTNMILSLMFMCCVANSNVADVKSGGITVTGSLPLSGSPCIDGVMENLAVRCHTLEIIEYGNVAEFDSVTSISCADPMKKDPLDYLYEGYTTTSFFFIDPDVRELTVSDELYFFCNDMGITVLISVD